MIGHESKWSEIRLDRNSPVPVYYQIKENIKKLIQSEMFLMGEKIPAERELCSIFEVSRMTVRQAVSELVKEGYLNRIKSKGTFLTPSKLIEPMFTLHSFSEDMLNRGLSVQGKTLKKDVRECYDEEVTHKLQLKMGDLVLIIERLRFANEIPMVLERSFFDYNTYKFLEDADLEKDSLFQLLEQHANIVPSFSKETIEAGLTDSILANHFKIQKGTPLLLVYGTSYTQNGKPIEYVQSFYRGDRFKLYVEMSKNT